MFIYFMTTILGVELKVLDIGGLTRSIIKSYEIAL